MPHKGQSTTLQWQNNEATLTSVFTKTQQTNGEFAYTRAALNNDCSTCDINCDSHSGQNVQMNYLTENILFLQILPWFHPAIDALAGAAPLHWPTSDIENRETLTLEVQRRVWFLWTRGKNPVQHGGFLWDRQFIKLHDETVSEMLPVKHFSVNLSFFLLICKHLISNKHFFTLIL